MPITRMAVQIGAFCAKDGDSLFLTCSVWRQAAKNVAESLQRACG